MTNKTKRLKDMEVGDIIGVPYYDMPSYRALVNKLEKTTPYRFKISGYNIARLDDSNIKKAKQRFTREEVLEIISVFTDTPNAWLANFESNKTNI